jgi:hypothetical protein
LAAVPLFRVPPYRGGTAEQFGRFAPAVLRNGAEQCGTAEQLSYPQALFRFPGIYIADHELCFEFVEILLSLFPKFDEATGKQLLQGLS